MEEFQYYPTETAKRYSYLGVSIMAKYYEGKYGGYFSALLRIDGYILLRCSSTKLHLLLTKCEGWIDHHKDLIDKLVSQGIDDITLSLFLEAVKDFDVNSLIQEQINKALEYQEKNDRKKVLKEGHIVIDAASIQAQYE